MQLEQVDVEAAVQQEPRNNGFDVTSDIPVGLGAEKFISGLIGKHSVLMFSTSTCPFCFELKRTLALYGVEYSVFELDKTDDMCSIKSELLKQSGVGTVPNLFVDGTCRGGCTDIKSFEHAGTLMAVLGAHVGRIQDSKEVRVTRLGYFYFPEAVDRYTARLTGVLTFVYSLLCVGFYNRRATPWVVLALAFDFLLRLIFGSQYSIGGMFSSLLLANVSPSFTAGPPKQFAAFCGLLMSTFAAGLFIAGEKAGGAVIMAMLMIAAGLEGILDFCLGCWMYGYAIKYNAVPSSIYRPYLNLVDSKKWMYAFTNSTTKYPQAGAEHVLMPWQQNETRADLIRKNRLESEYKNQDFGLIRHARVSLFIVPMTMATLAYMFKLTDDKNHLVGFKTGVASQALAIAAVIVFIPLTALFLLRALLYHRKLLKEWHHPIFGNMFTALPITLSLFGLLLMPVSENGGAVWIWIGAILQTVMILLRLVDMVQTYTSDEFVSPAMMMIPIGGFISALAFSQYMLTWRGSNMRGKMNYVQIGRLWFGIATLFTISLFTITFHRALREHHADSRLRPFLWVWVATFSIAGPAYLSVAGDSYAVGTGVLFQSLWCIALFLVAVCTVGLLRNFFSYVHDTAIWVVPFSLAAFAISTITYYRIVQDQLFMVLSIIAMVGASVSATVCGFHTLVWLVDLSLFKPRQKWGPISFMKLTHECFRHAIPKYIAIFGSLPVANIAGIDRALSELDQLFVCFEEHSRHEEQVIFPRIRRYFPALNEQADEEHETVHKLVDEMRKAIVEFRSTKKEKMDVLTLMSVMQVLLPAWGEHVLPHLRNEECTFTVVARKYMPIDEQIQLASEVFDLTDSTTWHQVMPFVINNLPCDVWKVRYLKTFLWAQPSRAQEVGLMVYHGVDSITWLMLVKEMPEIAPRGLPSHKRVY